MPIIVEENSSLAQPDKDCTLWRFMSIPKYLALISTKKLIFTQIALLRDRDPKEGHFTNYQILGSEHTNPMEEVLRDLNRKIISPDGAVLKLENITPWDDYLRIRNSIDKYIQYVSC